jgi:hypothetical protein
MNILTSKDLLGRELVCISDDDETIFEGTLSKKILKNKDLNYIYNEILKLNKIDEDFCYKMFIFGFKNIMVWKKGEKNV